MNSTPPQSPTAVSPLVSNTDARMGETLSERNRILAERHMPTCERSRGKSMMESMAVKHVKAFVAHLNSQIQAQADARKAFIEL